MDFVFESCREKVGRLHSNKRDSREISAPDLDSCKSTTNGYKIIFYFLYFALLQYNRITYIHSTTESED